MIEHIKQHWDDLDALTIEVRTHVDRDEGRVWTVLLVADDQVIDNLSPQDDDGVRLFCSPGLAAVFADEQRVLLRALIHEHACDNETSCPLSHRVCEQCRQGALDAGIPESVLDGKTTLRQHFNEAEIARMCGDSERAEQIEADELRDAGRGHLVRR